jgi:hypothetical protein
MLPVYLDCPFLIDSSVSLTFIEWGKCFELSYRKSDRKYDCKHFPSKKPPGANMGVSGFFYTWSVNLLIWSWFLINEFFTRKVWRCKGVTRSHKSKDRHYSDQTKDHKGTNNDLQNILEVSFIGDGNLRTRGKPPTCRKSLTNEKGLWKLMYINNLWYLWMFSTILHVSKRILFFQVTNNDLQNI